jgi:hypothetical protein
MYWSPISVLLGKALLSSLTHALDPTMSKLIWLSNEKGMSDSDYLRSTFFQLSRSLEVLYLSIAKIRFLASSVN